MKLALVTFSIAAMAVLSIGGATAVPSPTQLVFDGKHTPATFPTPSGLQHEGPFTTSSPLCPSGTAKDVSSLGNDMAARLFTCSSGARFTARVGPLLSEHGGNGTWQIVEGTGALADFRGMGTWQSARTGGNDSDRSTITFRSTWQGVTDMDATPPNIALARGSIHKLKKPARTYRVSLNLTIADGGGGAVSYTLSLANVRKPLYRLVVKRGQASTGSASLVFRIKAAKNTRALRLMIDATDAVGNESSFVKTVRVT